MPDYTRWLNASNDTRDDEVFSGLYAELHRIARGKMAGEKQGGTLDTTGLLHEAWLRLEKTAPEKWRDRKQFYAAAVETMRRILVEAARRHKVVLSVASAMVTLLLVGFATTTWQAVRATAGMQRKVAAEAFAQTRLEESVRFAVLLKDALVEQLIGCWQVDVEKTGNLLNSFEQIMVPQSMVEFQKDKMIIHGRQEPQSDTLTVGMSSKGGNWLPISSMATTLNPIVEWRFR